MPGDLEGSPALTFALPAGPGGPEALQDPEQALGNVVACSCSGANSLLSSLISRCIIKVLIAVNTKADHLHHKSHDLDAGAIGINSAVIDGHGTSFRACQER